MKSQHTCPDFFLVGIHIHAALSFLKTFLVSSHSTIAWMERTRMYGWWRIYKPTYLEIDYFGHIDWCSCSRCMSQQIKVYSNDCNPTNPCGAPLNVTLQVFIWRFKGALMMRRSLYWGIIDMGCYFLLLIIIKCIYYAHISILKKTLKAQLQETYYK